MHEFTTNRKVIEFTVDEEPFRTIPAIPAFALLDMSAQDRGREQIGYFLKEVLDEDSATRFAARLESRENPIDTETLKAVMDYLIEEITGRPTGQPSDSPDGSQTPGTSPTSTDDPSNEADQTP